VSKFPSIPDPLATIEGLQATVLAMKQIIEQLLGLRGDTAVPLVYIQAEVPTQPQRNEFWFHNQTNKLYVYDGRDWQLVQ
jgi:hypothetical protein